MTAILRALLALALLAPVSAFAATYDLVIDRTEVPIEGQMRRVFSINGQIAGPTLRWKEGEDVTINVTNRLAEDTSIHWHGVLLPYYMDGVPMVSFAGIKPGTTFTYRFKVRQSGHLLVPQPFRRPGAGGHVRAHRHRAGRRANATRWRAITW